MTLCQVGLNFCRDDPFRSFPQWIPGIRKPLQRSFWRWPIRDRPRGSVTDHNPFYIPSLPLEHTEILFKFLFRQIGFGKRNFEGFWINDSTFPFLKGSPPKKEFEERQWRNKKKAKPKENSKNCFGESFSNCPERIEMEILTWDSQYQTLYYFSSASSWIGTCVPFGVFLSFAFLVSFLVFFLFTFAASLQHLLFF